MSAELTSGPGQTRTVALVGNPNTGKTTLFNVLTGLSQRVGNYSGVTVERRSGTAHLNGRPPLRILDLPGAYSLSAYSPDEQVVADVLNGQRRDEGRPAAVLAIVDASNLERNLYLVSQVLEFGLPAVIALNMVDVAEGRGIRVDAGLLERRLGVPVVPTCASKKRGIRELEAALSRVVWSTAAVARWPGPRLPDPLTSEVDRLTDEVNAAPGHDDAPITRTQMLRAVVDEGGYAEQKLGSELGEAFLHRLSEARRRSSNGASLSTLETGSRYDWIRAAIAGCVTISESPQNTFSDRVDLFLTHRVAGLAAFVLIMGLVFQAVYTWAGPVMDAIDGFFGLVGNWVGSTMPDGPLQSLIVDGLIAGVGGVIIFLPQIAVLFLFLSLLEDCGYISRAALLMDKLLTRCGLSGKSFIPMLSCFACAVPGIMATRTIEDRKDRLATILVAPLMSCSARLPIYTIFIAAFIPNEGLVGGWIGLQGLTLFGMYSVGAVVAIGIAWLAKSTILKGEPSPFLLELPPYKWPQPKTVGLRVYLSCKTFLANAGTIILAATVVMWALAYFPRSQDVIDRHDLRIDRVLQSAPTPDQGTRVAAIQAEKAAELLEQSLLGRAGRLVEPAVRPLGWDWRIGMAAIASFPAREIIISSLGTIYSLGRDVDEGSESLRQAMQRARWADGSRVFTVPVALSIMVFFALCAQCFATLAVIKKETASWRWPILAFSYLTILAYLGALITYQLTTALGWGA